MGPPFVARVRASLNTPPWAGFLSFLFPGLGQASAGSRARGAIVAIPVLAVLGAFALTLIFEPGSLAGLTQDQGWLTRLLILNLILFAYHLWAVLDGRMPLPELLLRKRRHAAQTGEILLRVSDF